MMINSAWAVSRVGARANYKTRPENGPKTSVRCSGYGTTPQFLYPQSFSSRKVDDDQKLPAFPPIARITPPL
jgi:hypothetical protein